MAFNSKTRNRCWMITVHTTNMEKMGLSEEQYKNPEFLADFLIKRWEESGKLRKAGVAVCVTQDNCYHAHVACYGNTTTLKAVADVFCQAHVEPQLSGKETLTAYLKKEGKFAEKGETVLCHKGLEVIEDTQGRRNDFEEIEELLQEGLTPKEILEQSFAYRKYEKMIKSAYVARLKKTTPLFKENMWTEYHWGRAGSGKTFTYAKLCEEYGDDNVYYCNDYINHGYSLFDGYLEQPAPIVVMDEFRGDIPYSMLLCILDKYSRAQQHCRYQNVFGFWNKVYIMSIYPPEKVYSFMVPYEERQNDVIQQFMRRLNKIVYHYIDMNGEYKTFEMLPSEYKNGRDMQLQAAMSDALAVAEDIKEVEVGDKDEMLRAFGAREIGRLIDYGRTSTECNTNEKNND